MRKNKRKAFLDYNSRIMSNKSSSGDDASEEQKLVASRLLSPNKEDFTLDDDSGTKNVKVKRARRQSMSTTNGDDDDEDLNHYYASIVSPKTKADDERRYSLSPRFSGQRDVYKRGGVTPELAIPSTSRGYSLPALPSHSSPYRKLTVRPLYRNFQLLGDSQFVRFTKQILQEKFAGRSINYCVSGQTIRNLQEMLCKKTYDIHPFVIVLIGSNDLKALKCNAAEMIKHYDDLLDVLKPLTKKIILLTIPPVYINADSINHWQTFEKYNKHILQQHNGEQIFVVDLGVHLVGYHGDRGVKVYYEENYIMTERRDLLHLNLKGLRLLKFLLDLHYFEQL